MSSAQLWDYRPLQRMHSAYAENRFLIHLGSGRFDGSGRGEEQ